MVLPKGKILKISTFRLLENKITKLVGVGVDAKPPTSPSSTVT